MKNEWFYISSARKKDEQKRDVSGDHEVDLVFFDDDRFTIITCVPSPAIAHIHGRMPVILERHYEQDWLTVVKPFAQVSKMLTPYPNGALFAQEVTRPPQYDLFV